MRTKEIQFGSCCQRLSKTSAIVLAVCFTLLVYSAKDIVTSSTESRETRSASAGHKLRLGLGPGLVLPSFLSEIQPNSTSRNIYMLLTSEQSTLKLRHYCSLESYCLHNPGTTVWFLILGRESLEGEARLVLQKLGQSYPNLRVARLELEEAVRGTPLQDLVMSGILLRSKYLVHHLSDVLRLAIVAKAGGLYTDFDFISLGSVEDLQNTVALARPGAVMNGLFHFDAGHPLLQLLMEEGGRHFNGQAWIENGPTLFTNTLMKYCGDLKSLMTENIFQVVNKISYQRRKLSTANASNFVLTKISSNELETSEGENKDSFKRKLNLIQPYRSSPLRSSQSSLRPSSEAPQWLESEVKNSKPHESCEGVTLLPPSAFMPVHYHNYRRLFYKSGRTLLTEWPVWTRAVHFFNMLSSSLEVWPSDGSALQLLAAVSCPLVYGEAVSSNTHL